MVPYTDTVPRVKTVPLPRLHDMLVTATLSVATQPVKNIVLLLSVLSRL